VGLRRFNIVVSDTLARGEQACLTLTSHRGFSYQRGVSVSTRLSSSDRGVEPLTVSDDRLGYPVINPALMTDISLETGAKVNLAIEHYHLLSTHF
jgi:hypothetical protein